MRRFVCCPAGSPPTVSRKWLTGAPHLGRRFDGKALRNHDSVDGLPRVWRVDEPAVADPAVFLTDTGGTAARDVGWYMEAVDQFLEAVGRLHLTAGGTGRGRPVVGLPVVGAGRGGKGVQRGLILDALLQRLRSATARQPAIDYALVTFREADYETAQWVRRHAGIESDWEPLGVDLRRAAARLGHEAVAGDLVLFLGAGV